MAPPDPTRLILFTRFPAPGRTKTRLIPLLGKEGAASLARRMTLRALRTARDVCRDPSRVLEVRYDEGSEQAMHHWLGDPLFVREQGPGDLGQRMARAFEDSFREGSGRTVVIGTDCPSLDPDTLKQAFEALREQSVVLGPATDGGYYLIGLRQHIPELFAGLDWGTDRVLDQTRSVLERQGIKPHLLQALDDVDRPEDVAVWQQLAAAEESDLSRVSVIIPTLNEARSIGAVLETVGMAEGVETIVADAGSTDETLEIVNASGAQVVSTKPGRALQMNAGAAVAQGNTLLFLHGDTLLPEGWRDPVIRALEPAGVAAGAFSFGVDTSFRGKWLVERTTNLRSRYLQFPYGDQALFLRRAYFEELGGFPAMPIMEDYELVRRLRQYGRIITLRQRVATSARRWVKKGVLKTTLTNTVIVMGYHVGIPPERLARWYRGAPGAGTAMSL